MSLQWNFSFAGEEMMEKIMAAKEDEKRGGREGKYNGRIVALTLHWLAVSSRSFVTLCHPI